MSNRLVRHLSGSAIVILLFGYVSLLVIETAGGQVHTETSRSILNGLNSSDWRVRSVALTQIRATPSEDVSAEVKQRLVGLLVSETQNLWDRLEGKTQPTGEESGEGFSEYYADLIGMVLSLVGQSALPALVAAASEPQTEFNARLASYGKAAVRPVIGRLDELSKVRITRAGFEGIELHAQAAMADILAHILIYNQKQILNPALSVDDISGIRATLRPLLTNPNKRTRLEAAFALALSQDTSERETIRAVFAECLQSRHDKRFALKKLSKLDDPRFVPLEEIRIVALKDEFRVDLTNPALKTKYTSEYPIRALAQEVLRKYQRLQKR